MKFRRRTSNPHNGINAGGKVLNDITTNLTEGGDVARGRNKCILRWEDHPSEPDARKGRVLMGLQSQRMGRCIESLGGFIRDEHVVDAVVQMKYERGRRLKPLERIATARINMKLLTTDSLRPQA